MSRAGHPLTVLRDRNFRWFCTSDAVDLLGTSMAPVALAFAVLHVAGSAQALSQVLAAYIGAQVAFVLVGGLAADRFPRTLVLQGSNVVSCLAQGTVGALVITDRATITALVVLVAIGGAASAFGMPATEGVVPQLVTREHLQQANAIMAFGRRGSMVLGPAIAGLLVATAGPGWAIIADAATFLLATLALARVNLRLARSRRARVSRSRSSDSCVRAGPTCTAGPGCGRSSRPSVSSTRSKPARGVFSGQ